jgi:hypothetical protein
MVFVAGRHIANIDELSSDFYAVLKLIPDGYDWLAWALDDPSLSVYYAHTEQDLLSKIQNGLHETLILKCAAFSAHIDKIMSMDDVDMDFLSEVFISGATQTAAVKGLLKRYHLVGNSQLDAVPNFLSKFDLSKNPMFKSMSFSEELAMYRFQNGLKSSNVVKEAIEFGAQKGSTALEFIHFFQFYLNCVNVQFGGKMDANLRPLRVDDLYKQLSEVCFPLIYVPNVGSNMEDGELANHLKDFISTSKFVGYRLKASAMGNLALNVKINGASDDELKKNIEEYMTAVKSNAAKGNFVANIVPQDGGIRTFTSESDDFLIIVQVDREGDVFLSPHTRPLNKNKK